MRIARRLRARHRWRVAAAASRARSPMAWSEGTAAGLHVCASTAWVESRHAVDAALVKERFAIPQAVLCCRGPYHWYARHGTHTQRAQICSKARISGLSSAQRATGRLIRRKCRAIVHHAFSSLDLRCVSHMLATSRKDAGRLMAVLCNVHGRRAHRSPRSTFCAHTPGVRTSCCARGLRPERGPVAVPRLLWSRDSGQDITSRDSLRELRPTALMRNVHLTRAPLPCSSSGSVASACSRP
jgi:hypothetical protein